MGDTYTRPLWITLFSGERATAEPSECMPCILHLPKVLHSQAVAPRPALLILWAFLLMHAGIRLEWQPPTDPPLICSQIRLAGKCGCPRTPTHQRRPDTCLQLWQRAMPVVVVVVGGVGGKQGSELFLWIKQKRFCDALKTAPKHKT